LNITKDISAMPGMSRTIESHDGILTLISVSIMRLQLFRWTINAR